MTALRVVTNASPLIYLALVGRLSLLKQLFGSVFVPRAVYEEVVVRGRGQPGAAETQAAIDEGWIQQAVVQDRIAVDGLRDTLHLGEAETIILAREMTSAELYWMIALRATRHSW